MRILNELNNCSAQKRGRSLIVGKACHRLYCTIAFVEVFRPRPRINSRQSMPWRISEAQSQVRTTTSICIQLECSTSASLLEERIWSRTANERSQHHHFSSLGPGLTICRAVCWPCFAGSQLRRRMGKPPGLHDYSFELEPIALHNVISSRLSGLLPLP